MFSMSSIQRFKFVITELIALSLPAFVLMESNAFGVRNDGMECTIDLFGKVSSPKYASSFDYTS